MKTWNNMSPTEKYTQLLDFADCSIVTIEDMLDRDLAEHAIRRAYYYARLTGAVSREQAQRSYNHRLEYVSQHYSDVPELVEDGLLW